MQFQLYHSRDYGIHSQKILLQKDKRGKVNLKFCDMSIQQPEELKVEYVFRTQSFTSLIADLISIKT